MFGAGSGRIVLEPPRPTEERGDIEHVSSAPVMTGYLQQLGGPWSLHTGAFPQLFELGKLSPGLKPVCSCGATSGFASTVVLCSIYPLLFCTLNFEQSVL